MTENGVDGMLDREPLAKQKPWLSPAEQVHHLKSKGVRFELISEETAEEYLANNNNYFRLRSYRSNFAKAPHGARAGKYERLDFGMLVDLSIIDMLLRNELLTMALDIEHYAKMELLREIEGNAEDGYAIVQDFLQGHECETDSNNEHNRNLTLDEIKKGLSSAYTSGLLKKYPNHDYPAWVFMEIISFGTFIFFCRFCSIRFDSKRLNSLFYMLQSVKGLRNACAHNNCILNNMATGTSMHKAQTQVTQALASIGIRSAQRKSKMRNAVFQQIATTFYLHQSMASHGVHNRCAERLAGLKRRMGKHRDYYQGNDAVTSGFDFITKMIDSWYPWNDSAENGSC